MLHAIYYSLVGATLLLLVIWFLRSDWGIRSQFDLFVITWAYYALCVPVDLFLGLSAEGPFLLPDLNEARYFHTVVEVTIYYYTLAIGYVLAYALLPHATAADTRAFLAAPFWWTKVPIVRLPPLWLIMTLLCLVMAVYIGSYDGIDRGARAAMLRGDPSARLGNILTLRLTIAAVIVLIVLLNDRKQARWVVVGGVAVSLLSGGRTVAVFILVAYLMRHDVVISRQTRVLLVVGGFLFAMFLKAAYVYVASVFILGQPLSPLDLLTGRIDAGISFSGLEGIGGYAWPVYFLEKGDSPLWLGWSYVEIAARNTLPDFITGTGVPTLSMQFSPEVQPNSRLDPSGRAFSAIAEAWLNFGSIGPLLVGILFGIAAKILDTGPRGLFFILFAGMSMRLFRSDFASAYNSYIVVTGAMACLTYVLFLLWQHVTPRLRLERQQS